MIIKSLRCLSLGYKLRNIVAACPTSQIHRDKHTLTQGRHPVSTDETSDFIQLNVLGQNVKVHETWLRHHCKCTHCFEAEVQERCAVPNSGWLTSRVSNISVLNDELQVEWMDGHKSNFNLSKLKRSLLSMPPDIWKQNPSPGNLMSPVPINFTSISNPLSGVIVPYEQFMASDHGVSKMLESVLTTGYGVVSNVNGYEETVLAHKRISHPIRTIYGEGVTIAEPDLEHKDAAYLSVPLALHTDTVYFTEPMGLQTFHVLCRSETGGQNCLADGFLAAKRLFEESPELYQILSQTPLEFQYLEEGRYDFRSLGPTLLRNPVTGRLEQVRYNPRHFTTLVQLPSNQIPLFYDAFIRFTEILNENITWIQLEPGTMLFIDNWRILHGRNAFTGFRSVASSYIPRSDWLSRARVLGLNC